VSVADWRLCRAGRWTKVVAGLESLVIADLHPSKIVVFFALASCAAVLALCVQEGYQAISGTAVIGIVIMIKVAMIYLS
jgi:hypothetical protein